MKTLEIHIHLSGLNKIRFFIIYTSFINKNQDDHKKQMTDISIQKLIIIFIHTLNPLRNIDKLINLGTNMKFYLLCIAK